MGARTAEFNDFAPQGLVRPKVEFFLAVIAQILFGSRTGLQPVCADILPRRHILDDEMTANSIGRVFIAPRDVGLLQSLFYENFEAEGLRSMDFIQIGGQLRIQVPISRHSTRPSNLLSIRSSCQFFSCNRRLIRSRASADNFSGSAADKSSWCSWAAWRRKRSCFP